MALIISTVQIIPATTLIGNVGTFTKSQIKKENKLASMKINVVKKIPKS